MVDRVPCRQRRAAANARSSAYIADFAAMPMGVTEELLGPQHWQSAEGGRGASGGTRKLIAAACLAGICGGALVSLLVTLVLVPGQQPEPSTPAPAATGCDNSPCGEHGACTAVGAAHICGCQAGYIGEQCAAAFVVSRANSTDTNGLYDRAPTICNAKPVFQGRSGLRFFQLSGSLDWVVIRWIYAGDDCTTGSYTSLYLRSNGNGGDCPDSPDGAGCKGKWQECSKWGVDDMCSKWVNNPSLAVVASPGR